MSSICAICELKIKYLFGQSEWKSETKIYSVFECPNTHRRHPCHLKPGYDLRVNQAALVFALGTYLQ